MGATVEGLHRLQQIETELNALQQKIEAKHRAVRGSKNKLRQIDEAIAAKQAQLRQEQVEADRVELDRKMREAEIAKLRETLNRVKTNKEYHAVLTQINTDSADNAKLEERILRMYAALDQSKAAIKELEATRAKESGRLAELTAAAAQFEESVRGQIAELQAKREEAAMHLPPQAVQHFERVARKHDGQAMARVIQVHPRREEYVCEGCNISVTLEQISALQGRDDIQSCHSCGRILFVEGMPAPVRK